MTVEIRAADAALAETCEAQAVDLVWRTGAASYAYQFGPGREVFDAFVGEAWKGTDNLFAHSGATVAMQGEQLVGLEIGFPGADFHRLQAPLREVTIGLVQSGRIAPDRLREIGRRTRLASYLNAHIPDDTYYILSLAVADSQRGTGLGRRLLERAIEAARSEGFRELHLDVLSDNPAVGFYRALGLTCVAETLAPEPCREHGVPMEMRMVLPLGD